VNDELVLHQSTLAPQVAIVVDRGPTVCERQLQRLDDPLSKRLAVLEAHRPGRRERMELGAP
jgi:hypothetical protein